MLIIWPIKDWINFFPFSLAHPVDIQFGDLVGNQDRFRVKLKNVNYKKTDYLIKWPIEKLIKAASSQTLSVTH